VLVSLVLSPHLASIMRPGVARIRPRRKIDARSKRRDERDEHAHEIANSMVEQRASQRR